MLIKVILGILAYLLIGFIVAGIYLAARILTKYQVYPELEKDEEQPLKKFENRYGGREYQNVDATLAGYSSIIVFLWPIIPFVSLAIIFKDNIGGWITLIFFKFPLKIAHVLFKKKIEVKYNWDWMKK